MRTFKAAGKERQAMSVAASEHFALPRIYPNLREVNAYLGWFGKATRAMQVTSAINAGFVKIPGVKRGLSALGARMVKGSTGGPSEADREGTGSAITAIAYGPGGEELASVEVGGVNGYEFTGRVLAWGGAHAAAHGLEAVGALGPAEAFGTDVLLAGAREAGIDTV